MRASSITCQAITPGKVMPCLLETLTGARFLPKPSLFRGAACRSNNSACELSPCRKRNTQPGSSPSICIQKIIPHFYRIPHLYRNPLLLFALVLSLTPAMAHPSCSPAAAQEVGAHFPVTGLSRCEMLHIAARPRALTSSLAEAPEISLVGRKNIL